MCGCVVPGVSVCAAKVLVDMACSGVKGELALVCGFVWGFASERRWLLMGALFGGGVGDGVSRAKLLR